LGLFNRRAAGAGIAVKPRILDLAGTNYSDGVSAFDAVSERLGETEYHVFDEMGVKGKPPAGVTVHVARLNFSSARRMRGFVRELGKIVGRRREYFDEIHFHMPDENFASPESAAEAARVLRVLAGFLKPGGVNVGQYDFR
jgi:hypothetical protein